MKRFYLFFFVSCSLVVYSQNVFIPDANFKKYLLSIPILDMNHDSQISYSEASSLIGSIVCNNQTIYSLQGIEAFTSIDYLDCSNNLLTSLDLSKNTKLTHVNCSYNIISTLSVQHLSQLTWLDCSANHPMTQLDLSTNPLLTHLNCCVNTLTQLDLSQNGQLTWMDCYGNNLDSLNLSPVGKLTYLNCNRNSLKKLDVSQNLELDYLDCGNYFDSGYYKCEIRQLDLSKNTKLTSLNINGLRSLSSLDLSQTTALKSLRFSSTGLSSLDLSHNSQLTTVGFFYDYNLQNLNVANGNNSLISSFNCDSVPRLRCIQVSDPSYMNAHFKSSIYAKSTFATQCLVTGLDERNEEMKRVLIATYNTMGQQVESTTKGGLLRLYSDGKIEKVWVAE